MKANKQRGLHCCAKRCGRLFNLTRSYSEDVCEVLLITCRHHHGAALADSMAVIKPAAVIIRKNG